MGSSSNVLLPSVNSQGSATLASSAGSGQLGGVSGGAATGSGGTLAQQPGGNLPGSSLSAASDSSGQLLGAASGGTSATANSGAQQPSAGPQRPAPLVNMGVAGSGSHSLGGPFTEGLSGEACGKVFLILECQ